MVFAKEVGMVRYKKSLRPLVNPGDAKHLVCEGRMIRCYSILNT